MRWIADDPDPDTRAELQRVLADAMTGDGGAADDLADRMAGTAAVRHGRAARAGARRAERDERRGGPADHRRARALAARPGHARRQRSSSGGTRGTGRRRSPPRPPGCWPAAGFAGPVLPGPLPDPGARVRGPPARRGGRRADHRVAQPAGRQRLQGLPRRRRPSSSAPPDAEIEAAIAAAPAAVVASRSAARRTAIGRRRRGLSGPGRRGCRAPAPGRCGSRSPRCTASAAQTRVLALRRAGFTDVHVVAEQAAPDPDFPTVAFPNPEEPGATDALLALAERVGADLAVALDPDADRCALGVPDRGRLADAHRRRDRRAARRPRAAPRVPHRTRWSRPPSCRRRCCARSRRRTAPGYAETLTGFKWIVRGRRRAGLRLRGGARATASTRTRAGQGRHRGRRAGLRPGRHAEGRRAPGCPTGSTSSRSRTACTPPTGSPCGWSRPPATPSSARLRVAAAGRLGRRPAGTDVLRVAPRRARGP